MFNNARHASHGRNARRLFYACFLSTIIIYTREEKEREKVNERTTLGVATIDHRRRVVAFPFPASTNELTISLTVCGCEIKLSKVGFRHCVVCYVHVYTCRSPAASTPGNSPGFARSAESVAFIPLFSARPSRL